MPTPIKCLAWFSSDDGYGWTEQHYTLGPDSNIQLTPFLSAFQLLMTNQRRPLLGQDRKLEGVRVSYRRPNRAIASNTQWFDPPKTPNNQQSGSAPSLAVKMRMANQAGTQFSDTYLRGFWDVVEHDEQLDFTTPGGAQWKMLFDNFATLLVGQGYGFMGTNEANTIRGDVTGYASGAGGLITFELNITSGPALPAVGTILEMRVAKLNNSTSVLNTVQRVTVTGDTAVKTVVPTAAGAFTSAGTFVITRTAFVPYAGYEYLKLSERKPGRPFGRSRGRLKARARS